MRDAIEPVACTPSSGWEKGQIENQVKVLRNALFKPKLCFATLADLNTYLRLRCEELGSKRHPEARDQTVDVYLQTRERIYARLAILLMAIRNGRFGRALPVWFNSRTITVQSRTQSTYRFKQTVSTVNLFFACFLIQKVFNFLGKHFMQTIVFL
jgi:hypothetical protein